MLRWKANWMSGRETMQRPARSAKELRARDGRDWFLVPIRLTPSVIDTRKVRVFDKMYAPLHVLDGGGERQENGSVSLYRDEAGSVIERHMWFPQSSDGKYRSADAWFLALPEPEIINLVDAAIERGDDDVTVKGYVMAKKAAKKAAERQVEQRRSREERAAQRRAAKGGEAKVRGKYIAFGKYPTGKVLRWMGAHGMTDSDALLALEAIKADVPPLVSIKWELRERRHPAADLTKEEQQQLLAHKGKGAPPEPKRSAKKAATKKAAVKKGSAKKARTATKAAKATPAISEEEKPSAKKRGRVRVVSLAEEAAAAS